MCTHTRVHIQMSESKRGQGDIMRLLRRKRTTSSSSDNDDPNSPQTPSTPTEKSRGPVFPKIGKIPLTPLSKASPKSDRRSWTSDRLIDGKYDVTSKDKSVLERISQRVHRRGSRIRKPHEVPWSASPTSLPPSPPTLSLSPFLSLPPMVF